MPLYALTGNIEFKWCDKCDIDFTDLKRVVLTTPVLHGPNWEIPFHILSDASYTATGVVLVQEEDKNSYVIYYINKNHTPFELNYIVTKNEF